MVFNPAIRSYPRNANRCRRGKDRPKGHSNRNDHKAHMSSQPGIDMTLGKNALNNRRTEGDQPAYCRMGGEATRIRCGYGDCTKRNDR